MVTINHYLIYLNANSTEEEVAAMLEWIKIQKVSIFATTAGVENFNFLGDVIRQMIKKEITWHGHASSQIDFDQKKTIKKAVQKKKSEQRILFIGTMPVTVLVKKIVFGTVKYLDGTNIKTIQSVA